MFDNKTRFTATCVHLDILPLMHMSQSNMRKKKTDHAEDAHQHNFFVDYFYFIY